MNKIYMCSPLSSSYQKTVELNQSQARDLCGMFIHLGLLPIAPHIYFTQFLNDNDETQRLIGIKMGIELLKECDIMYVYDTDKISNGMKEEINFVQEKDIPIIYESKIKLWEKYNNDEPIEDLMKILYRGIK